MPVPANRREVEHLAADLIKALGLDITDEHFRETPRRIASLLLEFRQEQDLVALLKEGFTNDGGVEGDAMVVQSNIPIAGLCAHHFAPWFGTAHIGYLPGDRICGLSKLTRVAQAAGKISPTTQEWVTNTIADTISQGLGAKGVIVVTKAVHGCMAVRGVNEPGVETTISAIRGLYLHVPAARSEFFDLIRLGS